VIEEKDLAPITLAPKEKSKRDLIYDELYNYMIKIHDTKESLDIIK
jgi:hypothetical protein